MLLVMDVHLEKESIPTGKKFLTIIFRYLFNSVAFYSPLISTQSALIASLSSADQFRKHFIARPLLQSLEHK